MAISTLSESLFDLKTHHSAQILAAMRQISSISCDYLDNALQSIDNAYMESVPCMEAISKTKSVLLQSETVSSQELNANKVAINDLEKDLSENRNSVTEEEGRLKGLKDLANNLRKQVEQKEKELDKLKKDTSTMKTNYSSLDSRKSDIKCLQIITSTTFDYDNAEEFYGITVSDEKVTPFEFNDNEMEPKEIQNQLWNILGAAFKSEIGKLKQAMETT